MDTANFENKRPARPPIYETYLRASSLKMVDGQRLANMLCEVFGISSDEEAWKAIVFATRIGRFVIWRGPLEVLEAKIGTIYRLNGPDFALCLDAKPAIAA